PIFKEIKEIIGRDIHVKLKKAKEEGYGTIIFEWKFNYRLIRRAFQVAEEYRINPLSKIDGRYTMIYSQNDCDIFYPNIHDYKGYLLSFLNRGKNGPTLAFLDFIYIWDEIDKKLIEVWENDKENKCFR